MSWLPCTPPPPFVIANDYLQLQLVISFNADANYFAQRKLEELCAIGECDEREEFEDVDDICFGPGVHNQSLEIQPSRFM